MKFAYHNLLLGAGLVGTPLAPAAALGWELYSKLGEAGVNGTIAAFGGVGGAVCVEAVGGIAGYVGSQMYHRGDGRWIVGACVLALYAVYGVYEFGVEAMGMMFVFAACLYVLAALHQSVTSEIAAESETAHRSEQYDRDAESERMRREHELKLERIRMNHDAKMAKISADSARTSQADTGGHITTPARTWGSLTSGEKSEIKDKTTADMSAKYGVSTRTIRRWKEKI